jgi:hypothetical protein
MQGARTPTVLTVHSQTALAQILKMTTRELPILNTYFELSWKRGRSPLRSGPELCMGSALLQRSLAQVSPPPPSPGGEEKREESKKREERRKLKN